MKSKITTTTTMTRLLFAKEDVKQQLKIKQFFNL